MREEKWRGNLQIKNIQGHVNTIYIVISGGPYLNFDSNKELNNDILDYFNTD